MTSDDNKEEWKDEGENGRRENKPQNKDLEHNNDEEKIRLKQVFGKIIEEKAVRPTKTRIGLVEIATTMLRHNTAGFTYKRKGSKNEGKSEQGNTAGITYKRSI